jgi:hypothetical protein
MNVVMGSAAFGTTLTVTNISVNRGVNLYADRQISLDATITFEGTKGESLSIVVPLSVAKMIEVGAEFNMALTEMPPTG